MGGLMTNTQRVQTLKQSKRNDLRKYLNHATASTNFDSSQIKNFQSFAQSS